MDGHGQARTNTDGPGERAWYFARRSSWRAWTKSGGSAAVFRQRRQPAVSADLMFQEEYTASPSLNGPGPASRRQAGLRRPSRPRRIPRGAFVDSTWLSSRPIQKRSSFVTSIAEKCVHIQLHQRRRPAGQRLFRRFSMRRQANSATDTGRFTARLRRCSLIRSISCSVSAVK